MQGKNLNRLPILSTPQNPVYLVYSRVQEKRERRAHLQIRLEPMPRSSVVDMISRRYYPSTNEVYFFMSNHFFLKIIASYSSN